MLCLKILIEEVKWQIKVGSLFKNEWSIPWVGAEGEQPAKRPPAASHKAVNASTLRRLKGRVESFFHFFTLATSSATSAAS